MTYQECTDLISKMISLMDDLKTSASDKKLFGEIASRLMRKQTELDVERLIGPERKE